MKHGGKGETAEKRPEDHVHSMSDPPITNQDHILRREIMLA
jgi:hypothetical protein